MINLTSSLRFEYLFYPSAPAKHIWHLQYRHHGFAVDMFFIFLVPSIDVICWHNSTPFPVVVPLLLTIGHLRNILSSMRPQKHQAICAQGHLNRFLGALDVSMFPYLQICLLHDPDRLMGIKTGIWFPRIC